MECNIEYEKGNQYTNAPARPKNYTMKWWKRADKAEKWHFRSIMKKRIDVKRAKTVEELNNKTASTAEKRHVSSNEREREFVKSASTAEKSERFLGIKSKNVLRRPRKWT